eukprot:scaffold2144_cov98-Amphora_coffeaeformis.AAC.1
MASVPGLTLSNPVIPIISSVNEDEWVYVTLSNTFVQVGNQVKRKAEVPKLASEDVEHILRVIQEFDAAAEPANLNIAANGPKLFALFRQIVTGTIRDEWDLATQGQPATVVGFQQSIDVFLRRYILATDLADQKRYLDTAKKPFKTSCSELASRLRFINTLMSMFPTANNQNPYDDHGLKLLFYNMMLDEWKLDFMKAGRELSDPNFSYLQLARYMSVQEKAYNAKHTKQKTTSPANRPRGSGRGTRRGSPRGSSREPPRQRQRTSGSCPFEGHEGHDWEDCFGNPMSRNYRPSYRLPSVRGARRDGNRDNNRGNTNRGDNRDNRRNQGGRGYNRRGTDAHFQGNDRPQGNNHSSNGNNNRGNNQAQGQPAGASGRGSHTRHDQGNEDQECSSEGDSYGVADDSYTDDSIKFAFLDLIPYTVLLLDKAQNVSVTRAFLCLLDSGSTTSFFKRSCLPKGTHGRTVQRVSSTTLAGELNSNQVCTITNSVLPEFHRTRKIDSFEAYLFNNDAVRYDAILGRDFLSKLGIIIDFKDHVMVWDNATVAMRAFPKDAKPGQQSYAMHLLQDSVSDYEDDDTVPTEYSDDYSIDDPEDEPEVLTQEDGYRTQLGQVQRNDYSETDISAVAASWTHLPLHQRDELQTLLEEFPALFDGRLKSYPHEKVHLELINNATPFRTRPYAVPRSQLDLFKFELDRLVAAGVLEEGDRSEWISGTFIVPKKDGKARWVSDFRGLNKMLKRRVYPMPRISDILSRRSGYKFLSKIDISMQYYMFELDDESKGLCTIATPFGLYRYNRLPMGVHTSPDIAQEIMERIFRDLMHKIEIYIDDMALFSDTWEDHLQLLRDVLQRLQDNGFTVNPAKCEWAVQETDFLGHWLTPQGIKPWKRKVDAIVRMKPPTNQKEVRSFIGMVNYYRDMWPRRAHILAPLTELTGKGAFIWEPRHQTAFEQMKTILAKDALLAFPDLNVPFDIETDASDYQLGAVIKQNGRPVAYYSRKLNPAQRNYTTIEKELLSIVETLKEFRCMLLGAQLRIYTDHQNLTYAMTSYTTQRVLRWRLLLEEFGPSYHYKKGETNVVADALSRVPCSHAPPMEREGTNTRQQINNETLDELELAESLLEHPTFDSDGRLPFHFATIHEYQQKSDALKKLIVTDHHTYHYRKLGGMQIICRKVPAEPDWRIALSDEMLRPLVAWYHKVLAHSEGATRLTKSLTAHFHHPRLLKECEHIASTCHECQTLKRGSVQYGELAPRDALALPWQEVHTDCIGPWHFDLRGGRQVTFYGLTSIDPVTSLLEINRIPNQTSSEVARAFENNWLSRYPRPLRCIHDQGSEFVGPEFQTLMTKSGIESRTTTARNPQGNSIIERIHLTVGQVIRTLQALHEPKTVSEAQRLIDRAMATAMHATRCASSSALKNLSPGAIVFHRDMLLDIPLHADILTLQQHRQALIDARLLQANRKRVRHDYTVGERVLKRSVIGLSDKMKPSFTGPYVITQVHTNGTVTIRLSPSVTERINIRRIKPYRQRI